MAETATTTLNDVDIGSVASLAQKIQQEPDVAATKWAAEVEWKGGFRSDAKIRDFEAVRSDEPPALGGTNTGPNPVEQILGALGNCLAVGYAANATAMGIALDKLVINVEGDLDLHTFLGLKDEHAGFHNIVVKVDLDSPAPAQDIEKLHAKVASTSPVGHTLNSAIPVLIEVA